MIPREGGQILWLGHWVAGAAAVLVVVAVWTFFWYYREGRPSLPGRLALTLFRVAAVGTLLALLLEPTLRTERTERERSVVAVLVDRSDSMSLRDRWIEPVARRSLARWAGVTDPSAFPRLEWAARAVGSGGQAASGRRQAAPSGTAAGRGAVTDDWLQRLAQTHEVRLYAFGGERRPTTAQKLRGPTAVSSTSSRIGDAIAATLDEYAGQPLAGVVLLSDGGNNAGEDPMAAGGRAAQRRVPVFTVGIGDPTAPRDLSVASLLVDDVVRKGDEVPVSVGLKHSSMVGQRAQVTLRQDGREVATQIVTLAASGQQELEFNYRPEQAGAHALLVSAVPLAGEVSRQNNSRGTRVRVVEKRLRILYLEGSPRWEYRYLKNAIMRDPTIRLACLLMDSEPSGGGEGNLKVPGFPANRKQLFEYDIVILGDVARSDLPDSQLALLKAFVEERGGSLVVIAGEAHMPWEYRGSPLEALLPAVLPVGQHDYTTDEAFRLEPTAVGVRHTMLQLEADPAANRRRWESLPGGYWCGVVQRPKPGASVLLQAAGARRPTPEALPLMLVQTVGEGMSFLSLIDSTWRWRYRLGDTYFYRYWGQVLRTMTPRELPGENRLVKVTVDRDQYLPGDRVVLRARALTPTFHPLQAGSLSARLTRDDGTRTDVRLSPLSGRPGVYSAEWTPPRPGRYRAAVRAAAGAAVAEAEFEVEDSSPEQRDPELNRDLLQRVARASGGAYLELTDLKRLPQRIPDRSERRVTRTERPLWDAPLPLAIFSLLIVGEWLLRKRAGLL
jgi:hypothetical protein